MNDPKFATAITCIDGRTHLPVRRWLEEHFAVDFVDRVTEPGVDRILAEGTSVEVTHLRDQACLSAKAHHANVVVVVGHHDCAANPVSAEEHRRQIKAALKTVTTWHLPATIIGLWLNEAWAIEVVEVIEPTASIALGALNEPARQVVG